LFSVLVAVSLTATFLFNAFPAFAAAPTVTVQAATTLRNTTVLANGNITNLNGGSSCTERGFEWDTDSGAPYTNTQHTDGSYGTGAYAQAVTGLPSNSTIYIRAWATNDGGTSYSAETTFHTSVTDAYWVGASGNWSDAATHWAESSGGAANAEHLPTAGTNVY
jgi:hypothetical protein